MTSRDAQLQTLALAVIATVLVLIWLFGVDVL